MSARIDEEPIDLDLTWGDDPEPSGDRPCVPITMPPERGVPTLALILGVIVVLLVTVFGLGRLSGAAAGRATATDALAEARHATDIAEDAALSAAEWRTRAEEASDTIRALQGHTEALESRIETLVVEVDALQVELAKESRSQGQSAPTVSRSRSISGVEQWRSLVARYFPSNAVDDALSVMAGESGGNPSADNGNDCLGLFQLSGHHGTRAQRLDPTYNVATAARIYAASGWSAWSVKP